MKTITVLSILKRNRQMDHNTFAKIFQGRMKKALALTEHFRANHERITKALNIPNDPNGTNTFESKIEALAFFIVGFSIDTHSVMLLDGKGLGIIKNILKIIDIQGKESFNSLLFLTNSTPKLDIETKDVITPIDLPRLVESKVVIETEVYDLKVNEQIAAKMDLLVDSIDAMFRALLDTRDQELLESMVELDDDLGAFASYLVGAGITADSITNLTESAKANIMDLLVKYLSLNRDYSEINALIMGIMTVNINR